MGSALHDLLSNHPNYAVGGPVDGQADDDVGDAVPSGLVAVAEELISAVKAGDAAQVANALEDAFELLEASPHAEAPNEEA